MELILAIGLTIFDLVLVGVILRNLYVISHDLFMAPKGEIAGVLMKHFSLIFELIGQLLGVGAVTFFAILCWRDAGLF